MERIPQRIQHHCKLFAINATRNESLAALSKERCEQRDNKPDVADVSHMSD